MCRGLNRPAEEQEAAHINEKPSGINLRQACWVLLVIVAMSPGVAAAPAAAGEVRGPGDSLNTNAVSHLLRIISEQFPYTISRNISGAILSGSTTFSQDDINDSPGIIYRLRRQSDPVSAFLWQSMSEPEQSLLRNYQPPASNSKQAQDVVVQTLNRMIAGPSIYEHARFRGIRLGDDTINDGSLTFSEGEIHRLSGVIDRWRRQADPVSAFLWQRLSSQEQLVLRNYQPAASSSKQAADIVVQALNRILGEPGIYERERFKDIPLRPETIKLMEQGPTGPDLAKLNRLLLEDAFPLELATNHIPRVSPQSLTGPNLARWNRLLLEDAYPMELSKNLVSLRLPDIYDDDQSLALLGTLSNVSEVEICGGLGERGEAMLTGHGMESLAGMTSLTRLQLLCLTKFGSNVLRGVSSLSQVRELTIYNVPFPSEEFRWLKRMTNLAKLDLEDCPNFRDQELLMLTNWPSLKEVRLLRTGVSPESTNLLRGIPSLTNLVVDPRLP